MAFGHARVRVTLTRLQGRPLDDDAAEAGEVDKVGKFQTIAEGAGGCQHRVLEGEGTKVGGQKPTGILCFVDHCAILFPNFG